MKKNEKDYITVLDLGSDSIRALCAIISKDGIIEKIWYSDHIAQGYIVNGWVEKNSQQADTLIRNTLVALTNKVGITDLGPVYVCTGGHSSFMRNVTFKKNLINKRPINTEIIEEIIKEEEENIEKTNASIGIIETIPFALEIDGIHYNIPHPSSIRGSMVKIENNLCFAKKDNVALFKKIFEHATISVSRYFFRPRVLLSLYTKIEGESIIQNGCAIMDLGAQTSTLSIFKNNECLLHSTVLKGGKDITSVIAQLGISVKLAEELKCRYGFSTPQYVKKNLKMFVPRLLKEEGELAIDQKELANIIAPKLAEVLSPLISLLNRNAEKIQVLYITGGASMLRCIDKYIQEQTSVKVLYGTHNTLLGNEVDDMFFEPRFASLIGSVFIAHEFQQKKNRKKSKFVQFKDSIVDIFTNEQ